MNQSLANAEPRDELGFILNRASPLKLVEPGPTPQQLELLLRAGVRAPDHGRLRPWRFIVIEGDARRRFGDLMAEALQRRDPAATPELLQRERDKPLRAPCVIVVAAVLKSGGKIPEIEQHLAAGAAAQNIMLAAHALGLGAMWKTGAPAYDPFVKERLGLGANDPIVGFLYIGTPAGGTSPLPRAEPTDVVLRWGGGG